MNKRFALTVAALALMVPAVSPCAAEEAAPIFLSHRLTLPFTPEDAFFLVEIPPAPVQRLHAEIVPLNAESGTYVVGVKVRAANPAKVAYSILVLGKGNQFESVPLSSYEETLEDLPQRSSEALQDYFATRKEVLSSYNLQVQSQEASLRRLRQDAELIGGFDRVTETNDEVERLKADIAGADKSAQTMETLIRLASSLPPPKNAIARETQLTMQLGELAQAAKNAEAAEMSRKVGMEDDLRRKLAVVEAARFEDYDALQRQLDELRSQRMALEKQKGISPEPAAPESSPLPVSPDVDY